MLRRRISSGVISHFSLPSYVQCTSLKSSLDCSADRPILASRNKTLWLLTLGDFIGRLLKKTHGCCSLYYNYQELQSYSLSALISSVNLQSSANYKYSWTINESLDFFKLVFSLYKF